MAQQDTGLGWSAKDDWLVQGAGSIIATLKKFGGSSFPGQPIPQTDRPAINVITNGVKLSATVNTYFSAAIGTEALMFAVSDPSHRVIVFVSTEPGVAYKTAILSNGSYFPDPAGTISITGVDSVTGLYYAREPYTGNPQINPYIPVFATEREGLDAIEVETVSFTKSNAGYAVACVAKWKTSANVVIQTPILISSDRDYSEMSTTGTYQFATYNTIRDGKRFYMSFYQDIDGDMQSATHVYDISSPEEPYANLDEIFNLLCAPDQANILVTETVDPYEDFPHTEEDAGEPDPDPEDDDIEEADLPTMSFATAGFCRIYRPSFAQVSALASYMWTDQNFLQTVINHLKQILENPIDAIISLSIVPCVPAVLADEEVKVMYVPTGVYMPPVQRQFVEVDCGSYTLKEMYGSALDYNPYTSVQLYLPYVGIVQLDTDEVMGKTLSIGYRIDVVTGVCCAYVKANGDVLYQFSGHCSIQQPITSADFSGYINAALAAGKLVASIAAAGAGAPAVAATLAGAPTPSISGSESRTIETERNPNTGRQITMGTTKRESQTYNPGASFGEVATRGVSNTVGAVMNSKTIVQHSGGFSGNSGFMAAVRRPYLIVTRPRIANPENYGKYNGRPSMIYLNLGDCTGFTQVQSIQLTGIDATNPELSEIATLLNSGVIL